MKLGFIRQIHFLSVSIFWYEVLFLLAWLAITVKLADGGSKTDFIFPHRRADRVIGAVDLTVFVILLPKINRALDKCS